MGDLRQAKSACFFGAYGALSIVGQSSNVQTESAAIYSGRCWILGIKGITDGSNALTLSIYDALTATGDIWDQIIIPGADYHGGIIYPNPMEITTGIYVASSGGTHKYVVYYAEIESY